MDNQEAWQVAEEGGVNTAALKDALEAADAVIADYITFASRVLSLSPGATAILSNGRVSVLIIHYHAWLPYTSIYIHTLADWAIG